jgi:hypothetical protein
MLRFTFALLALVSTTSILRADDAANVAAGTPTKPQETPASPGSKAADKKLPTRVDLRPQMTEWGLVPRRQGRRNTCSVFATTGVFEFAASKQNNKGTRFSVEYLNWACNEVINNHTQDRGQFFRDLLRAYEKHGICSESEMAYTRRFDPELKPSDAAIASAQKNRDLAFKVHWLRRWRNPPGLKEWNLRDIKQVLASGYPVAAGASHSRIIVGYEDDAKQPAGGIFHTQDSGSGRFDKVTYEFALKEMNDLFWVEAPKP